MNYANVYEKSGLLGPKVITEQYMIQFNNYFKTLDSIGTWSVFERRWNETTC